MTHKKNNDHYNRFEKNNDRHRFTHSSGLPAEFKMFGDVSAAD
jgi:hypothetical protein